MTPETPQRGFFHTLPGVLTAIAAVITAVAGLMTVLNRGPSTSGSTKEILRHFAIKFSTDRQGADYKDFDLPEDKYELCAKACDEDPQCRAFVYTPRGHEGPNARCWLKATTPAERPVPGFVTGVKLP